MPTRRTSTSCGRGSHAESFRPGLLRRPGLSYESPSAMERPTSNGQEGAQAAKRLAASALETLSVNHPSPGMPSERAAPSTSHQAPPLGLYIHVPFCSAICNYCNFNRGLFDEALKGRYVKALIQEIRHEALNPNSSAIAERPMGTASGPTAADTIYFGGGTPSLLEPNEV